MNEKVIVSGVLPHVDFAYGTIDGVEHLTMGFGDKQWSLTVDVLVSKGVICKMDPRGELPKSYHDNFDLVKKAISESEYMRTRANLRVNIHDKSPIYLVGKVTKIEFQENHETVYTVTAYHCTVDGEVVVMPDKDIHTRIGDVGGTYSLFAEIGTSKNRPKNIKERIMPVETGA